MTLGILLETHDCPLGAGEEDQVRHHLQGLEPRLAHHPEPKAVAVLTRHQQQRKVAVSLRVELGPLGEHLVSHQSAGNAPHAMRLAVEDVERQLERHLARQRGEHTYGVPSRRLPKSTRPHPLTTPDAG